MTRRSFLGRAAGAVAGALGLGALASAETEPAPGAAAGAPKIEPLDVPAEAWKPLVSAQAFAVLFEEETERAGSSPLEGEKRKGLYLCAACYLPLFDAATKFDSGTGWPSFYDVLPGRVGTKRDFKLLLPRTEYHCIRCGGHQGHVFHDGPEPTGLRYCNNGVALRFVPEGEPLPALREPA